MNALKRRILIMAQLSPDDLKTLQYTEELIKDMPFYIRDFRIEKLKQDSSIRTIHNYLVRYKVFFKWLMQEGLVEVTEMKEVTLDHLSQLRKRDIELFVDFVKGQDISDENKTQKRVREIRSVSHMVSALKSLFHFLAVTSEDDKGDTYLIDNIMNKVKIPIYKETSANRAAELSTQILDSSSLFSFIDYLEEDSGYFCTLKVPQAKTLFKRDKARDIAIISLLLATGIRVGELARITMEDIHYGNQTIKVVRKGNKKDTVYVMSSAFEHLLDYIKIRNQRYPQAENTPFLFVTYRKPAQPIRIRTIQMLVEKYTSAYFEKGVYPHKLRHSFATAFIKNGGEMTILRDLLGHSDITTTALYVNISNSEKVDALNSLERMLQQN